MMRSQPAPPPPSPNDSIMENDAEIKAQDPGPQLPGQCLEYREQRQPRVTSQLFEHYTSEENEVRPPPPTLHDRDGSPEINDGSSSDIDESSESDATTTSATSPSGSIDSSQGISPSQYQVPRSTPELLLPGQIPVYDQRPLSISSFHPGFIIPEEWFHGPEIPDLIGKPNYESIDRWFIINPEVIKEHMEVNRNAFLPYQHNPIPEPSQTAPPDDVITVDLTCTFRCTLSTKPFRRLYHGLRSRCRRAARRIRGALRCATN
ncbi:uncharacterized protein LOC142748320 [Rhinoderma darwinii]|uniref:uncharacterized protein LOC142748320 n=1 Tax=Rhinoderma darwinii TaxID=43563 RepID=UPI003F661221